MMSRRGAYNKLNPKQREQIQKYVLKGPTWTFSSLKTMAEGICEILNLKDVEKVYMHIYYLDKKFRFLDESKLIKRLKKFPGLDTSDGVLTETKRATISRQRINRRDEFEKILY